MAEDGSRIQIECSLGEMELAVSASDSDDAHEIFEEIWTNRVAEKRKAESLERQNLEQEVDSIHDL